jgi:hypothetical protein
LVLESVPYSLTLPSLRACQSSNFSPSGELDSLESLSGHFVLRFLIRVFLREA